MRDRLIELGGYSWFLAVTVTAVRRAYLDDVFNGGELGQQLRRLVDLRDTSVAGGKLEEQTQTVTQRV